ncbi:MAG: SDR family oxidoreductase [Candidatus Dormibacteraeota bacterium]|nr:SDR family oxidoreductase [Candidatus Dormibacteraeota bacterium]MBJ7607180.1 SDR family oxidoreductase [Candidatus Dormibacteraeota bacterium]
MDLLLDGKVVVVSGASSGIGRATARLLALEGCRLAIGARTEETLDEFAAEARSLGGNVITQAGDLVAEEGLARLVTAARRTYGGVDGLVACVGSTPLGEFGDLDDQLWNQAFEMKFLATARAFRAVLPEFRARGGGRAVFITGNAAHAPLPSFYTSGAINAALGNLIANLAREYGSEQIGVNAVSPGPVSTHRYQGLVRATSTRTRLPPPGAEELILSSIPDHRVGAPDEVAHMVVYLLSQRAAHMNGTVAVIDGGQTWVR